MKLTISAKCSDLFYATLHDENKRIGEYHGYVPNFFPGDHYGDYVQLEIDTETGMITNWQKPTSTQLEIFTSKDED